MIVVSNTSPLTNLEISVDLRSIPTISKREP
jgi:hypothetical protein